uniref:Uncharacterized protein n=1 Tax=Tetranychus urticae TaxID=32264 RepID=T1KU19_TETUR
MFNQSANRQMRLLLDFFILYFHRVRKVPNITLMKSLVKGWPCKYGFHEAREYEQKISLDMEMAKMQ